MYRRTHSSKTYSAFRIKHSEMRSAIAQEDHAQRLTGKSIDLVRPITFLLFFVFGSITSLNDVLMPALKELFALN